MPQTQHTLQSQRSADYRRRFRQLLRSIHRGQGLLRGASWTGMIDVVFNLLIFFVVITTATQREGVLPGDLPAQSWNQTATDVPALPIRVNIYAGKSFDDCQLELLGSDQRPGSFRQLYEILLSMHISKAGLYEPDNPVVLSLGTGVSVDQMVKTYNAVVLAGFTNIQFTRSR